MLSIAFIVTLAAITVVPSGTLAPLRFATNNLPTPVAPPPFTFDPLDGNGVCNIAGYYEFKVATKALIQGVPVTGEMQVILTIAKGVTTRRFVSRAIISNSPGINSSGNTLVGAAQIDVGDVVNVSVLHDVSPNEVSFPQTENMFIATLIQ